MGTNYYFEFETCPHCGYTPSRIHLGKNSYGWKFLLQHNSTHYAPSWNNMKDWLKAAKGVIKDEYGRIISKDKFIKLVENNQTYKSHSSLINKSIYTDTDGYEFCLVDFS